MTSERKEDWIRITQPDGQNKIAAPSYIVKLLGLGKRDQILADVFNRLERLERQVDRLEAPGRQAKILELLRGEGPHNQRWISNRVKNYQWYDLDQLLVQGLIEESKAGYTTMYSCVSEEKV